MKKESKITMNNCEHELILSQLYKERFDNKLQFINVPFLKIVFIWFFGVKTALFLQRCGCLLFSYHLEHIGKIDFGIKKASNNMHIKSFF